MRMLDQPHREISGRQKYKGWIITYLFLAAYFGLSIGVVYRLDVFEQGKLLSSSCGTVLCCGLPLLK